MNAAPFESWEDRHRAAARIVDEAAGWGQGVDLDDPEMVLAWARRYLPMVLEHGSEQRVEG